MNYEMFGIIATLVILSSVLTIATAESADIEIPFIEEIKVAEIHTVVESNPYYEWCFKMKIECS